MVYTGDLLPWWKEALATDIHYSLLVKEDTLSAYKGQSPQLDQRRFLVDWLAVICEEFGVCHEAKHLAVHLLDHFMDHFEIDLERIHLVVLGCLLIACKFEESEVNIPRWHHLDRFIIRSEYESAHYQQMELLLLDFFNWNIAIPTASHFATYYMMASLQHERESISNSAWIDKIAVYLEKYVKYFLEISLQDHCYRYHKPSLVAVACVAASRACMQLNPVWPTSLSSNTKFTWEEVSVPVHSMLLSYQVDEKASKENQSRVLLDSGYSSPDCCTPSPCGSRVGDLDDSPVEELCASHLNNRPRSQTPSPTQLQLVANFQEEMIL